MMRAIHLFPDFGANETVAAFRRDYDPLALKIPPHITLVFPFESVLEDSLLISHARRVAQTFEPFWITFAEAEDHAPDYVWLPVLEGEGSIRLLHAALYSGPLMEFRSRVHPYRPHVTVARSGDRPERVLSEAAASIDLSSRIRISRLVVERISPEGWSEILYTLPLVFPMKA